MARAKGGVMSVLGCAALLAPLHASAMQDLPKIKVGDTVLLAGPSRFIDEDSLGQYQSGTCTPAEQAEADAKNKKLASKAAGNNTGPALSATAVWQMCFPATFTSGYTLRSTWMQHVRVEEIRGSLIRYLPFGNHPLEGWADIRGLMTAGQFAPLKDWPSPGSYKFCVASDGCFELRIEADAGATLTQFVGAEDDCVLEQDKQSGRCRATGPLSLVNNFLMFPDGSESGMFFSIDPTQVDWDPHSLRLYGIRICPVEFGAESFACSADAYSAVYFAPEVSDSPGATPISPLK